MPAAPDMSRMLVPSNPFSRKRRAETRSSSSRRLLSLLRRSFFTTVMAGKSQGQRNSCCATLRPHFELCKCLLQSCKIGAHDKHRVSGGDLFSQLLQLFLGGVAQGCV